MQIDLLENSLGYTFKNKGLLIESLTHSSYSYEHESNVNYERLEFLGDAVLELVVSEYIINTFEDMNEGDMSKLRSYVVNEGELSEIAKRLTLHEHILLGKGERTGNPIDKRSILADCFEAICAAIYIDGGYEHARTFALREIKHVLQQAFKNKSYRDAKSELQEYTQKYLKCLPQYTIIEEVGEQHKKTFTVEATIGTKYRAVAQASTKREASKIAAGVLLDMIEKGK